MTIYGLLRPDRDEADIDAALPDGLVALASAVWTDGTTARPGVELKVVLGRRSIEAALTIAMAEALRDALDALIEEAEADATEVGVLLAPRPEALQ